MVTLSSYLLKGAVMLGEQRREVANGSGDVINDEIATPDYHCPWPPFEKSASVNEYLCATRVRVP